MNDYRVKVRYTFEGWFEIAAESEQRACEIAERDCGLVIGGNIHTNNESQVVDWEFETHPEKKILAAQQVVYNN
jgi:muramoyltetrapeptide carboxypeptidase LdcA involved in peptidoglycan recycling